MGSDRRNMVHVHVIQLFMIAISMMLSFHILFLSPCYCTPGDDSVGPSSKRRKRNKTAPPFKRQKRNITALPFKWQKCNKTAPLFKRQKHDTADITTSELPEGCYYHCCISRVKRHQLFMVAILLILYSTFCFSSFAAYH